MNAFDLWQAVRDALPVAVVAAPGVAWFVSNRQKGNDIVAKATADLITQLHAELVRVRADGDGYRVELHLLRAMRFTLDDVMADLRDAALAARVMVHELQRKLGEPETAFKPLPRPGGPAARDGPA